MSVLQWPRDEQGFPHREAARVILIDERNRVLLVRGHDADNPTRSWWFTVGGGVEDGETSQETALREVFEETGIQLNQKELVGPVARRQAVFDFKSLVARQDEVIFWARVQAQPLSDSHWTPEEQRVIDEYRWWDLDELEKYAENHEVYPRSLCDLIGQCLHGWDGTVSVIE